MKLFDDLVFLNSGVVGCGGSGRIKSVHLGDRETQLSLLVSPVCVSVLCTHFSDSRSPDSSSPNPLSQGIPPSSPPGPPHTPSAPPPPMPPPPLGSPFPVISSSMGSPGLPPPAPPGFSGPVSSPQVRSCDTFNSLFSALPTLLLGLNGF